MLIGTLPGSLLAPANLRYEVQHLAVKLVGDILDSILVDLEVASGSAQAEAAATESAAEALRAAVCESEAALASAIEEVTSRSVELDAAAVKTIDAEKVLTERQNEQRKFDPGLVEVTLYRDRLEMAANTSLRALQSGECSEKEARQILKGFLPLVKTLDLEESLMKALPTACAKKPSQRGKFDLLVIQQLEGVFTEKVATMSQEIQKREKACQSIADKVNDARQVRTAAQEAQKAASVRLVEAKKKQSSAGSAVEASRKAIADSRPSRSAASYAAKMQNTSVKDFRDKCLDPFVRLREKSSEDSTALPGTTQQGKVISPGPDACGA
jgi:hypothetical protein